MSTWSSRDPHFKDPPWQIGFVKCDFSGTVSRGFSAAFSGVCAHSLVRKDYMFTRLVWRVLYVHSLMKKVILSKPCEEDYACARRHYNGPLLILHCGYLVLQYCTHQLCIGSEVRLVGPSASICLLIGFPDMSMRSPYAIVVGYR
jgi:hypothetical protein